MTVRRSTYLNFLLPALTIVMCLSASVYAAPPQFNPHWTYHSTVFSPFPGFESPFLSSITPTDYVPLIDIYPQQRMLYEYDFDYENETVTYRRRIKDDQMMVPVTMSRDDFFHRRIALSMAELSSDLGRKSLVKPQSDKAGSLFQFTIPIRSRTFESIFGEGGAGLKVSGYRKISFSGRSTWNDGPQTALNRQSKFPVLQMEQVYRFDIEGTIGSKISVKVSQDSRNDIPLANRLILRYKGGEDDILQTIEAGNTTLNLPSTQFLAYSTQVRGLFGIKATAKLADLEITAIASQEKGSTETIEINAGTSTMATNVIRDIDYKKYTIYDLGRLDTTMITRSLSNDYPEPEKYDFFRGDSIVNAVVYLDDWTNDQERFNRIEGYVYIDPEDTLSDDPTGEYIKKSYFEIVDPEDYFINERGFYVQFLRPVVSSEDVVAVYMEVKRANSDVIDTIGDISGAPLKLKLIKPKAYVRPNRHIWEYEWRNVYYLGSSNIELRELEMSIKKGATLNNIRTVNPDDPEDQEGTNYLQVFGLDQGDDNGAGDPDKQIDRKVYIDPVLGLLFFPNRHPFDSDISYVNDANGDPITLKDTVPELYNSQLSGVQASSKYYMAVNTQQRGSADIQLNATNIIENSEVITAGGVRLNKGTDYEIDYDFGRLVLLNDDNANSDLSIMFETAPFFSLARKTLLGTRLEYAPNRDFRIGSTILYKSDRSTSRKPKVGEETSKIFVWDVDFNYDLENPLFTSLIDALPLVTATAPSYLRLSAEVAQSYPNPNVDGEVFIDDFEGSKNSYSLGVIRTNWRHASPPAVIDTAVSERARISWSNPFEQVAVDEIWNRDVGTGESNRTNVLDVYFKPVEFKRIENPDSNVIDSIPLEGPEKSWAGFMRNFSSGVTSQLEEVQQLEIRLHGDVGIMHIDLGRISEDIDGNGVENTEDPFRYRTLDTLLDNGLDMLPDSLEVGYDPENGITDPAEDNWAANDIWRINGTEGNRNDPDGGYYPDTEDADYDGMDYINSYFSYRVDLSDTTEFLNGFHVNGTLNDAGWRTIRIPLRDPLAIDTMINEPSWQNIENVRVWFDSAGGDYVANPYLVRIASIELLSTTWADSFVVADSLRSGLASFGVSVINDEIDTARYTPPPGVEGHYDQSREALENEQSLMMVFDNLNAAIDVYSPDSGIVLAADTGLAVRKFFRASNYMGYGKLEMYVYGGLDENPEHSDSVLFFFRMGYDKEAYYEYRTVLKPKWDPDNFVSIDFKEITGLKARLLEDRENGIDSSLVRYDPETGYLVKIKPAGQDPTLTRIQYFSMGVVNLDPDRLASGEVWADELRLTEVRDDVGTAARFAVSGNMSDLITYTFSYSFRDAYFRGVSSATKGGASNNLGSGQVKKDYLFGGTVKLDKLFPRSLEMQMPLTVNWSQNVQEPLLKAGTDILVPDDLKETETSLSLNRGFRISEKFSKRTKNILYAVLLNRLTTSFGYNISEGRRPTEPMFMNERYDAKATYDMSIKRPPSITPLAWMSWFRVPFGLPRTRLYLYPSRLDFSGQLNSNYNESLNQNGNNPTTRTLEFRGGMNMRYQVFDNLNTTYTFSTQRDLREPETVLFSFKRIRLGVEQNYSQSFRADYKPTIFRFLTHSFDYSATYGDTYRISREIGYHAASSKTNAGVSVTFKHQAIIGSNKRSGDRGIRGEEEKGSSILNIFGLGLKGIRYITDAIKPVSGKFNTSRTLSYPGLSDKASQLFRFGLTRDPGVDAVTNISSTNIRASHSETMAFSANSGMGLFAGISVDVGYSQSVRETFDNNPTKTFSETWPDLKFNLRSIKGLWYLGRVLNKLSPASSYSRTTDYRWNTNYPSPHERSVKEAFAPLISFTMNPFRTMRSSIRYETSTSTGTSYSRTSGEKTDMTKRSAQNLAFNWSFSFRNPSGIRLPLFGRIKFESNLSITLDVNYRKSQTENAKSNNDFIFRKTEDKSSLTIRPGANYSFSSTVKGGLTARWQDSNDSIQHRKSHTREVGIWVELRF